MRQETAALCERLAKLQSDAVSDVLDKMGFRCQVLSADIRAIGPRMQVAGPAFCIKGQATPGSTVQATGSGSKPGFEMFRRMYHGCVVVIETGGYDVAGPWGENTALSARVRGCIGVVIDGGTRDSQELIEMGFPTFVRFVSPVAVEGRWTHVAFEVPITMPGQACKEVVVNPGDLILADADGVVVIPKELAEEVVEDVEEVMRIEALMRKELAEGVDREQVYRKHDRYGHIRRIRE